MFNDPTIQYEIPDIDSIKYPAIAAIQDKIDVNFRVIQSERKLSEHWRAIWSHYSIAYKHWDGTGEHEEGRFKDFAKGDAVLQYCHMLEDLSDCGAFSNLMTRNIPHHSSTDVCASKSMSSSSGSISSDMVRVRKRTKLEKDANQITGAVKDLVELVKVSLAPPTIVQSSSTSTSSSFSYVFDEKSIFFLRRRELEDHAFELHHKISTFEDKSDPLFQYLTQQYNDIMHTLLEK